MLRSDLCGVNAAQKRRYDSPYRLQSWDHGRRCWVTLALYQQLNWPAIDRKVREIGYGEMRLVGDTGEIAEWGDGKRLPPTKGASA